MLNENHSCILIVDDDIVALKVLKAILQPEGYTVFTASTADSAVLLTKANKFDLILLDIMIPGQNGFELFEQFQKNSAASTPGVIFLSGTTSTQEKVHGLELGAMDFIGKPFDKKEVIARVKRHLLTLRYQHSLELQKEVLLKRAAANSKVVAGDYFGNYEILELIGKGGMARVYKARHIHLNRILAVKIMDVSQADIDESDKARFLEEAKAMAMLRHPNIIEVYDSGMIESLFYIAMEFFDGADLQKNRRGNTLAYSLIYNILRQAAQGLNAAHKNNIIHRDVKPENMLMNDHFVVKLVDFGLAKNLVTKSNLTQTGILMGTPAYMSPEHVSGKSVDARSDIYSLGITLYFLITGQIPFGSSDTCTMLLQKMQGIELNPKDYSTDVPELLCAMVAKMTQKDPKNRYQSMEELLAEINSRHSFR